MNGETMPTEHAHHRDGDSVGYVSRAEYSSLDRLVRGNGQPGIVQKLDRIVGWVERQEGLEEAKRGARSRAKWVFGIVLTVFIGLGGWAFNHIWGIVAPPAGAIIQEYWEHHPAAKIRQKSISGSIDPAYAENKQDAGIPATVRTQ